MTKTLRKIKFGKLKFLDSFESVCFLKSCFQKYTAGDYCPLGPALKQDKTLPLKEGRKMKYGGDM